MLLKKKVEKSGSENCWIDDDCFNNLAKKFINHVNEFRETFNYDRYLKAILFLDGHGSQNSRQTMELYKMANIKVIIFPPHLTHLMTIVITRHLKNA